MIDIKNEYDIIIASNDSDYFPFKSRMEKEGASIQIEKFTKVETNDNFSNIVNKIEEILKQENGKSMNYSKLLNKLKKEKIITKSIKQKLLKEYFNFAGNNISLKK